MNVLELIGVGIAILLTGAWLIHESRRNAKIMWTAEEILADADCQRYMPEVVAYIHELLDGTGPTTGRDEWAQLRAVVTITEKCRARNRKALDTLGTPRTGKVKLFVPTPVLREDGQSRTYNLRYTTIHDEDN